ncbi:hypothetical protein ABB37_00958 [Leptomonas pyrrhocoris]|uniref:Methyltransferase n=1 Tax=Leptomonas pyrrhocoris TaxID=157538 RepID=A0A0N0E0X7_LEPPY|nr:hypothetical protein ABB37_00958 [Leptomonas pyrrhocoris]XP_015665367.1 hypothetical protein ABB37_00958 [Leptomonas pyrrhocoris]KPA86927.1 hypothetical protein ABB37_00958 [Leptomonas pyrrhocoris]KPA86928.1 hypothetical protein ABB37_00958 [Leptomonas pyrrhocoris]|eukprot:XP_015665366.1 hypothetical protein ABB37_00958 [Leptomonas pyrrhocoris]
MEYKEDFEVVTAADGTSALSVTLACATVREHYDRTTTAHSSVASDPAEVCSTGLRVYEGAQVLAAFMYRYGVALLPPVLGEEAVTTSPESGGTSGARNVCPPPSAFVVELGCGCGLVGFTLDAALHTRMAAAAQEHASAPMRDSSPSASVSLIFTDASEDCLALVRRSGRLAGRPVRDLDATPSDAPQQRHDFASPTDVRLSTLRLTWSDEGVKAFQKKLPASTGAPVQLVLGSDLMYYRVDVDALVYTAKSLLLLPAACRLPSLAQATDASSGFVVFAHFMRIPDGQRTLATVARERHGMAIAAIPLSAFVDTSTVRFRSWSGVELVLLGLHSPNAVAAPSGGSGSGNSTAGRAAAAAEDLNYLKALLEARGTAWERRCATASRQARALAATLQPYPSSVQATSSVNGVGGDAAAADAVEEAAFLHLLL